MVRRVVMALLDDVAKAASSPAGLVAGVGALLRTPVLVPAVRDGLRPAAKAVLRMGITAYRETVEPVRHAVHDLVTEAQLELASSSAGAAAPAEEQGKGGRGKRREA